MRGLLALLAAALFVPFASADPGGVVGTEDLPELPDAQNDVRYAPSYVGPTDHRYIDLEAAWYEYDNSTDEIQFIIKTAGAEQLRNPPTGWNVRCLLEGNVTIGGSQRGTLVVGWEKRANGTEIESFANWGIYLVGDTSAGIDNPGDPVKHGFSFEFADPGYFRFFLSRSMLLKYGDEIENPHGYCTEHIDPANAIGLTVKLGQNNFDDARSKSVYSFRDVQRIQSADGTPLDPIERFERENATASPTTTSLEQEDSTPFVGVAAGLLAVAIGAVLRRRRQ